MRKYGRAAKPRKGPLNRLSGRDRKFFDSADHALSSAGVQTETETGTVIATAQNIPRKSQTKPSAMVDHTQEVVGKEDEEEKSSTNDADTPKESKQGE